MDRYEFMRMPISLFPKHIIKQYDLIKKLRNGFIYLEIRRIIYGLPQAGMFVNEYLEEKLAPHGYCKVPHTPGLWKYISHPVQLSLVVDNFGVKYVGREHVNHLTVPSRENLQSAKIRKETCIVAFHFNGIMKKVG